MVKHARNFGLLLAVLLAPASLAGQEATDDILQTAVIFSGDAATLELELASGRTLELQLDGGIVRVGGKDVARYERGGSLDSAWRDLLRGLSEGDLSAAWTRFLAAEFGEDQAAAGAIADVLAPYYAGVPAEAAATAPEVAAAAASEPAAEAAGTAGSELTQETADATGENLDEVVIGGLVVELTEVENLAGALARIGLARELSRALNGDLDTPVRIIVGADEYRLPEGTRVDKTLVLVETDAVIAGTVGSNIVVADGSLLITPAGVIEGDVIGIDANVHNQGTIRGTLRSADNIAPVEAVTRVESQTAARRGPRSFATNIARGVGSLLKIISVYALFAFLGALAVYFFRAPLETVSDTVSYSFGRSFLAGVAGQILFFPVGVVMTLLVITAIAVPFYVVGALLLGLFGYLGVAHAAGENLTRYRFPSWAARMRRSNSYYYMLNGLGVLLALFVGAAFTRVLSPILGWAYGLLIASAWIMTWVASTAGFGAALLSRAGTRRTYARPRELPALPVDTLAESMERRAEPGSGARRW